MLQQDINSQVSDRPYHERGKRIGNILYEWSDGLNLRSWTIALLFHRYEKYGSLRIAMSSTTTHNDYQKKKLS